MEASDAAAKPKFSFKKKAGNGKAAIRKRAREPESSDGGSSGGDAGDDVVRVDRKGKRAAAAVFSSGSGSKPQSERGGDGGAASDDDDVDPMAAGRIKSTRAAHNTSAATDATRYSEIDTAADRDARAVLERNIKLNAEGQTNDETGIYRGMAAYKNHITKQESQVGGNKHTGTQGPIRAPQFFRASCRFDYQPDVCKDYKETGFCGFGDSCKFIHDRGDYKSGWQIEKEWEEQQKKKRERAAAGEAGLMVEEEENEDDAGEYAVEDDEGLPFACFICREGFTDPVVTNCGHYFCERCALDRHRSGNPRCAACNKQTSGVFNVAKKVIERARKLQAAKNDSAAENDAAAGSGGGVAAAGDGEGGEAVALTSQAFVKKKKGQWATAAS